MACRDILDGPTPKYLNGCNLKEEYYNPVSIFLFDYYVAVFVPLPSHKFSHLNPNQHYDTDTINYISKSSLFFRKIQHKAVH